FESRRVKTSWMGADPERGWAAVPMGTTVASVTRTGPPGGARSTGEFSRSVPATVAVSARTAIATASAARAPIPSAERTGSNEVHRGGGPRARVYSAAPSPAPMGEPGPNAPCVFCDIVARRAPAFIIYEDATTLAFL